uniref:DNA repair metallo-beta-lactamase domain-containing protein n=1 Tax=Eptatretus burgeri TaxID=7764 RepID=A0A8C4R102_EPTBU
MPLTSSPKHSTMTSELFIIPESPLGKELVTETKEKKITSKTFPHQVHASNKSAICAMKGQSSHSEPIDLTVDLRMVNKNSINSQEPIIQNKAQKPGLKGNHLESKNLEVKQEVFSNRNNFTTSLWINPSENLENIPSALKLSDTVVVSDSDDFEEVTSCLRSPRLTSCRGRNRDGGKSKNGRPPTKKNKANEYEGDGSYNSILQELNIKGTTRKKKKETNNINKNLKERRPASERGYMGVTNDQVSTWPGDDLEVSFDLILEENTLEQESMQPKIRLLRRRKSRTQGTQTSPETKGAVPEFPTEERQHFSRKGLTDTDIDASTWPKKVSARSREKRTVKAIKSRKSLSFHSEETPADEQENRFIQGALGEQQDISTDPVHWVTSHPTLPLLELSPPRRGGIQHWNYKGEDGIRPEIESFRREESKLLEFMSVSSGTSFSVDTFSCGAILGCKAYFLSHFHSHCYRGLTSTFVNTIYCSKVTGNLLRSKLGVRDDLIHRLPLHTVCLVEAIRVVLIEANHCPGSVMFLFLLDDGKRLLYTGDFRVDQSMLKNPHLTALRVDVCYLDTMHCQPDWEFPTRAEMKQFVQGVARKALKRNPRTLLVSGYQYLGHEALFMALAEVTGAQAAMAVDMYDTMLTLGMEELRSAVTLDFHSSQLHVLPILQLGIKGLRTHWKKFMSRYDYILAFKPSGWPSLARRQALNGLQPCVTENIILYAIPFSEHSSYSELRHFVQWLQVITNINDLPSVLQAQQLFHTGMPISPNECLSIRGHKQIMLS